MSSGNSPEKSLDSRLKAVLAENSTCADCPAQRPLWASYLRWPKKGMADESRMDESSQQHFNDEINVDIDGALGVMVCNDCAQHHHFELGKKRCLIKYLKYSHELTARDLDILEHSGNDLVNEYYEANLWGSFQKELILGDVEAEAKRRGKFIKEKYKKCLYRDHAGIAKAVQQCLKLQTYQKDIEVDNKGNVGKPSSSRRRSTASPKDPTKHDDKIANAVRQIRRTKSGGSDYKRTNSKDKNQNNGTATPTGGDALPKIPRPGSGDSTASTTTDVDREEIPKYNPTGKTYTQEFNLEAAKEKEEEKAVLLKEFIEKGPDPNDDEFSVAGGGPEDKEDEEEDDANSQAGWGIHCLKSQLQVVKTLGKTEIRSKPARERGVTVSSSTDPRRASTLAIHMAELSESKRNLRASHIKRTASMDHSSSSLNYTHEVEQPKPLLTTTTKKKGGVAGADPAQLDNLQAKMKEVQSALEKTMGVAESLKKTTAAMVQLEDASVQSVQVSSNNEKGGGGGGRGGGRGAPGQRGVLRRNSSLSDLDKLKRSGTSDSAGKGGGNNKRGGRKKNTIALEARRKKRNDEKKTTTDESSTTKQSTVAAATPFRRTHTINTTGTALRDNSKPTTTVRTRGRSGSISPSSRRRMRRGSSMSDLTPEAESSFLKEWKSKRNLDGSLNESNNTNKSSTLDESSLQNNRSRSRSGSVSPRRGPRRGSVASSSPRRGSVASSSRRGSITDVSGGGRSDDESAIQQSSPRRKGGKRIHNMNNNYNNNNTGTNNSKSPTIPDHYRRSSMSDMSGSNGSGDGTSTTTPSRSANLSDKLSKVKGVVKKTGAASVASMPVLTDRSTKNANKRDRSKTRSKPRIDRSRSSSGERDNDNNKSTLPRTDSGGSRKKEETRSGKRRGGKRGSLTDLPELKESPSNEAATGVGSDAATNNPAVANPATTTTTTDTSKAKEAETTKIPKNKNRSRSPKKEPANNTVNDTIDPDVGTKLAALPDMKPKTRKDAKSIRSMPPRSRSSSAEGNPRGTRDRSRSPKRRTNLPDMHKSMSGVNLMQQVDDDLKKKATANEAASADTDRTKDNGVRFTGGSKKRSKSPNKRLDMHKSLSGLDETSLQGISDLQRMSGLDSLSLKKGSNIDTSRSRSTKPPNVLDSAKPGGLQEVQNNFLKDEASAEVSVASTTAKARESASKLPQNKNRSRSPKPANVVDSAQPGGLQDLQSNFLKDEASAELSVASTNTRSKESGSKLPQNKGRSRSPKASFHMSHGLIDATKLGGLQDLRNEFLKDEASTELSVASTSPKTKDASSRAKSKSRSRSPKKDTLKMNKSVNAIDAAMLNNLSNTISQVRTLVGPAPSEKDSGGGGVQSKSAASRKDRKRRSVVTPIPESSEPDSAKLHSEMAEKMKQFKMRNERVDNTVRSTTNNNKRANRRRSSFSGSFSELTNSDHSEIKGMLQDTLQSKTGKDKTNKKDSSGKNKSPIRRRSSSLNDLKKVTGNPENAEERMFLRTHMNAMLDDSSGNAW